MKTRVVIVDDSPFARIVLREILEEEGDIAVVGTATDGTAALDVVRQQRPALVTMDIQMAGAGGLAAIEQLMAHAPVPILVVTALPRGPESNLAFEALRRGALDVATKPSGPLRLAEGARLRRQVRSLAGVPVVRHVGALRPATVPGVPRMTSGARVPLVGIAASAGGPIAVAQVLGALPGRFPACVAVVQHLPIGFAAFFADFLRRQITAEVVVASGELEPRAGAVIVAPDDRHLVLTEAGTLALSTGAPEGGHRPSATTLFRSLARFAGATAIGVVLTGIGDDGTAGLLAMRQAGALTIAQDARTSAVFGMPRAAAAAGAVATALPLDEIALAVVRQVCRD